MLKKNFNSTQPVAKKKLFYLQGPSTKNVRSNGADERPPVPRQQQQQAHGQHVGGYGSRQNGYAESVDGEAKQEDINQVHFIFFHCSWDICAP